MKRKSKDLSGQKFTRLTVIKRSHERKIKGRTRIYWLCRCECGKETVVGRDSLISENTRSCGCLQREITQRCEDIVGKTFGRLTVVDKSLKRSKCGHRLWTCRCSCGNYKDVSGISLIAGNTRSCGCLHAEAMRKNTLPDFGSGKNKLYHQYKTKAEKKGRLFDLTEDEFFPMTQQNCHYCGSKPSLDVRIKPNSPAYRYNGIDRVDNTRGYSKDNCVTCCSVCNYAKRSMTHSQFLKWVSSVYHHVVEASEKNERVNNE
jgi:hypothetical protein